MATHFLAFDLAVHLALLQGITFVRNTCTPSPVALLVMCLSAFFACAFQFVYATRDRLRRSSTGNLVVGAAVMFRIGEFVGIQLLFRNVCSSQQFYLGGVLVVFWLLECVSAQSVDRIIRNERHRNLGEGAGFASLALGNLLLFTSQAIADNFYNWVALTALLLALYGHHRWLKDWSKTTRNRTASIAYAVFVILATVGSIIYPIFKDLTEFRLSYLLPIFFVCDFILTILQVTSSLRTYQAVPVAEVL